MFQSVSGHSLKQRERKFQDLLGSLGSFRKFQGLSGFLGSFRVFQGVPESSRKFQGVSWSYGVFHLQYSRRTESQRNTQKNDFKGVSGCFRVF